jgi:FkbM family methyltransferase
MLMEFQHFLYRRLCRWITCSFELWPGAFVAIDSKFARASFQDVFCDPFYWQIFHWITPAPRLVVDCGAHCGHFTLMSEKCLLSLHGKSEAEYLLIEPNPALADVLRKNIRAAGLAARTTIKQNLLGKKSGTATLWVQGNNYLTASMSPLPGGRPHVVEFLDLPSLVGDRTIDLMKIDIEGGEFDLVRCNLDLFKRVRTIFMELHTGTDGQRQELLDGLRSVGLVPLGEPLAAHGYELIIFHRPGVSA